MAPKAGYHVRFAPRAERQLKKAADSVGVTVNAVIKQLVAFGLTTHPVFGKQK